MTRINTIDPQHLTDQHLFAEWREITRLPAYVQKSVNTCNPIRIPEQYTMGAGHVKFFYNKAVYVQWRYAALTVALLQRGYDITFKEVDWSPMYKHIKQTPWKPDTDAHLTNITRIIERVRGSKMQHTVRKQKIDLDVYTDMLYTTYQKEVPA